MSEHKQHDKKHVKVTFAASSEGPYTATEPGSTTASTVLAAAMSHFGVASDSQFSYVLAFDGTEVNGSDTLDQIAGDERNIKFTLVKKITQG